MCRCANIMKAEIYESPLFCLVDANKYSPVCIILGECLFAPTITYTQPLKEKARTSQPMLFGLSNFCQKK